MKVLVLENSRLFQKMLRDLLIELDCSVSCVRSAEEGLQLLTDDSTDEFNLIIASQHIFDKTGQEFIDYCKASRHKIPIILLTSEPNETLMKNARAAGIRDVFPKSNLNYLKSNIRYCIRGKDEFNVSGARVLYVEDSPSVAHLVSSYLRKLHLDITHFESAEEAFHAFCENDFDLVVTDLMLSGPMDGLSLVRMIRALNSDASKTPILAMTGHDDAQQRIDLFRAGINDYVTKPPLEEELAARVNNLIINKRLLDKVREQKSELYNQAMTDQLTTCHNRHSLSDLAPKMIKDSVRYDFPLSIMILDLDNFKQINDSFGHDTGDTVLRETGRLLMDACRQGDIVARIGGEEFLILLPHCDIANALRKAEHYRAMIELAKPADIKITTSIGVASLIPQHHEKFDKLFKAADDAVYHSKNNGRNQVTVDPESMEEILGHQASGS